MSRTENQSEVARLLDQIRAEYEAAQRAMTGPAHVARHSFITARTENMGKLHEELHKLAGDKAMGLVVIALGDRPLGKVDEFGAGICPVCGSNGIRALEQDEESIFALYRCAEQHEFEIDRALEHIPAQQQTEGSLWIS